MDRKLVADRKRLAKKAKRGFRGYPVGSLTYYGPDDSRDHRSRSEPVIHPSTEEDGHERSAI